MTIAKTIRRMRGV